MKKRLHKRLLILTLVLIPAYFLLFTGEGNRISDNALLWLFGRKDLMLSLQKADKAYTEAEIKQVFGKFNWKCDQVHSQFGTHACNTAIGSFNGLPARHAVIFFVHDHLNAIKIAYRRRYHDALLAQLIRTLGQPRNTAVAQNDTPADARVLEWNTGHGLVVLNKTLSGSDEPALMWLGTGP